MNCKTILFKVHAIKQMYKRYISEEELQQVVSNGDVIQEYTDDQPFPSRLILSWVNSRPLHVVVGYNESEAICFIVTAYQPDPELWENDFRTRRVK